MCDVMFAAKSTNNYGLLYVLPNMNIHDQLSNHHSYKQLINDHIIFDIDYTFICTQYVGLKWVSMIISWKIWYNIDDCECMNGCNHTVHLL